MKLIDERNQARTVAARWNEQYPTGRRGPENEAIARKLQALNPETSTAAQIAEIIGNKSWCGPHPCHECGKASDVLIQIGEEPDYESSTARVCRACLQNALNMIDRADAPPVCQGELP